MNFKGVIFKLFVALLLFSVFLSPVMADEKKSEDEEKFKLETVKVTADKREEDPQKLTTSISVLSDTDIENAKLRSTMDIGLEVSNMKSANWASRDISGKIGIRGLHNTAFGDPAVALYIDGVSYADIYALDNPLFDVERIEVLKGPQGTLYGKNAAAGVINVISKAPTNLFSGNVLFELGTYNKRLFQTSINTPVIEDKLFLRFAGLSSYHNGYVKNIQTGNYIGDQETLSGRVSLIYNPTDRLSIDFVYGTNHYDDDGGYPYTPLNKSSWYTSVGVSLGEFECDHDYEGESETDNSYSSLKLKYEANNFDFVSVTSYRDFDGEGTLDNDFSTTYDYIGYNKWESQSINQEFRLQSKDSDKSFKWVAGMYFSQEEYNIDQGYSSSAYSYESQTIAEMAAQDIAVFGQTTYRLMENKLGLTAGLRYEKAKRELEDRTNTDTYYGTSSMSGLEKEYDEFLPKVAVDYLLNKDAMVYFSISRGYKAGGYVHATNDPDQAAFDPEISTAFEIGLKTEFPEKGIRANLAFFYTNVKDFQDKVQVSATEVYQQNAEKAHMMGLEAECRYKVNQSLSFNFVFGYTSAKYDDYVGDDTGTDYKDNSIILVPQYDSNLYVEYRAENGIYLRAGIQNIGKYYFDRENDYEQKPYTLLNARVGYETEKWDIFLTGKNLTDKEYAVDGYNMNSTFSGAGYDVMVGDPLTVDLTFTYRF